MLFAAAALTLVRVVRGPTFLDRVVAMDVLIAVLVCALGLEAAVNRHDTTLPILVSLSLVGFVGAVSVARLVSRDRHDDEGVRT
jgi:multicomponent Na+:H+ antiporter subunit F